MELAADNSYQDFGGLERMVVTDTDGFRMSEAVRDLKLSPEKTLMLAEIEDALSELLSNSRATPIKRQIYNDAHDWLMSDNDSWPFAFVSICDVLGLDSDYLRRGILKMAKAAKKKAG